MLTFAVSLVLAAAYWPGISGAAMSPRWIIAAIILPLILFWRHNYTSPEMWRLRRPSPVGLTISGALGLSYVAWAFASFLWSENQADTLGEAWTMAVMASAFCLGMQLEQPRQVYLGAAAGLGICGIVAVAQWLGWEGIQQVSSPSGLYINKNFYAEICALVAVALIAERLWWALPAVAPGLLLTNARGALLAFLVAIVAMLWKRSRRAALAITLIGAGLLMAVTLLGIGKFTTISDRLDLWRAALSISNWHGYGLGTFFHSAPKPTWIQYHAEHPHNEFVETIFETGFVGGALLIAFLGSLMWGPLSDGRRINTERLVLIALIVESFFEFPLHLPATALLGCAVAGHLARSQRRLCGAARRSGVAIQAGLHA